MFLEWALKPTTESLRGSEYREAMLLCMLLNDGGCWHERVFFLAKIRAWWRWGGGKNRQRSAPDHPKTNGEEGGQQGRLVQHLRCWWFDYMGFTPAKSPFGAPESWGFIDSDTP